MCSSVNCLLCSFIHLLSEDANHVASATVRQTLTAIANVLNDPDSFGGRCVIIPSPA